MTNTPDGIRDRRLPPFCYQTIETLADLRAWYSRNAQTRLSTALAIYLTLTEHANRNGGRAARAGFTAYRAEMARDAGVSTDTFDRYIREFEEIGLVAVERQQEGRVSLPNTWVLTDPPGRTHAATPAAPVRPNARVQSLEKKEPQERSPVVPVNRPVTVNRKPVSDLEYEKALAVLAAFNQEFGTRYGSVDFVAKIIRRIREQPTVSLADHLAIIRAAHADPWWKGPPNPSVVYGNAAQFERSAHAAMQVSPASAADRIAALGLPAIEGEARRA